MNCNMSPAEFIDDPNWARFIPEAEEPVKSRSLPAHEDCAAIDADLAVGHLKAGGTLGSMRGYEERQGQMDMLHAVARAFNGREHLMVEAGTGVGKSLAYLIPSILWAHVNDTPVVIATATRNLQSQLMESDIPKALSVLGGEAGKFKVALLKGRGNYLCLRAVDEFFASGYWTMTEEEQSLMPGFIEYLKTTRDGDLDRYEGVARHLLTCPGEECGARRCKFRSKCFIRKARRSAADAHLVVANHALVLAEATSPAGGILPNYGRLVVDEAHNLESTATEYLSREFSLPALARILSRISRGSKGRRIRAGGLLAGVERQLQKGAVAGEALSGALARLAAQVPSLVSAAVGAANALSRTAERLLRPAAGRELCRYKVDGVRMFSLHSLFKPYEEGQWDENALKAAQNSFEAALAGLVNLLYSLRDALDGADRENGRLGELSVQSGSIAEALVSFANDVNFVLCGDKPTHAYWAEKAKGDGKAAYLRLVAAPLSVAGELRQMLYDAKDSTVLCSATFRVGNDFRYMSRRLGCAERFRALVADSPFDYFRQAQVLSLDCLPDPTVDGESYAVELAKMVRRLAGMVGGRTLVLFTSYEMMNAAAGYARDGLREDGLRLLVQGEGMSREAMTRALKNGGGIVVFGAQSFWEGVDVAGEALSCVVLARLPFAQVGDPVVEARSEKIDREGGSSFRDYALPEAVIKFRQGFGRLIRTKSDRGVVVVTDPRIVTKNYGAVFRKSIPASVHTLSGVDELLERVRDFISCAHFPDAFQPH